MSTFIGLIVSFGAQLVFFPLFGLQATLMDNLGLTTCFTGVSLIRSYGVRRLFNYLHLKEVL